MLSGRNIHKSYGQLHVLKGIDIDLSAGEVVSLVGASGAGKSTLLQILGTLDKCDSGTIEFKGRNILAFSARERARLRNEELGFVFQFHHLLPEFTALENVMIPGMIARKSGGKLQERSKMLLTMLGLEERLGHKPSQLSGGEQQRVAIARALVNEPSLILADEPTGNLDSRNSEELYQLIFGLARETGVSFLIATHNEALAARGDRLLKMQDGLMVE